MNRLCCLVCVAGLFVSATLFADTVTIAPAEGVTTNVLKVYSGETALNIAGPGTVKLNAANSHTGGTTLSGGTLVIADGGTAAHSPVGAGGLTITGGTLVGSGTFGGNITGTGVATILAPNGWTWTGNNTFAATNYIVDGILEIAGGSTTFSKPMRISRTTEGVSGLRVTGGTVTLGQHLYLCGAAAPEGTGNAPCTYEQTGGTVKMGANNIQFAYAKGTRSTFTMTGGTFNANGKNAVSGYSTSRTTNTVDISGTAVFGNIGSMYSYTGAGNLLAVNVHDGGTLGFVKLYRGSDNKNTAMATLRVNGGVLRNDKTGSSATAYEKWIGNTDSSKNQLTAFTIGPKGATFLTENGDAAGIAQVYSPITAEPAAAGETAAGVNISGGRFAYYVTTAYEGPTILKDGATLYVSSAGTIPSASAVTVGKSSMLRLLGTDKTISSLTLEDGAALGLGTNGVRAAALTVSGAVSLPKEAKIGLYNSDKLGGTANTANGTYVVFKVPAAYEAALRAVHWSCATATSGKSYTFSVATSGDWATLSMTIANSTVATDTGDVTVGPGEFVQTDSSLDVGARTVTVYGGNLYVGNSLTGTGVGGQVFVENGGLLVATNNVRFSTAAGAYYDLYVRSGGIVRASQFFPNNSNYISNKGDLLHINGGTLQMVAWDGDANNYQNPRYVSTYVGAGGATFDLSHWQDKGKPGWFRFTCEALSFYHDPDCVGDDGGITVCGSNGDRVLYYFKSINEDSTMNGGITVADGGAISTVNGLTNQTVRIRPGGMFRSYQKTYIAPIKNLILGETNATKPVELVVCKDSEKPTIAVLDTLSVLSSVEINVAQEWRYDASLVSGVYTALVYQASCSVDPSLFQLPAGSSGTLAASEVTLSGGDYNGWKALVVTIDNAIVVTGSASYPTPKTVASDVTCDKVIVGGAWIGEVAAPAVDTSLTISGNVKASTALYMGYNPPEGASADNQSQGTLTIANGASLSVPVVYSAYREANNSSNVPRYGSEIYVNGGLLDVSGNVRFGNHWSRYGEKIYSRLTVNGGRVSVGGTFYLSYWYNTGGNRTMPGCIVLNAGEVDVKGKIDLSRNKVEGNDIVSYANCFGVFLNGGVLKAENIMMTTNATKPKVVFNGGTYVPYGAAAANRTMQGLAKAYVSTNGAVISTANLPAGATYTIAQNLLTDPSLGGAMDGGLTKKGIGTLALTGANTYTGPTVVECGTLVVNAGAVSSSAVVEVANDAVLDLGGGASVSDIKASGVVAGDLTVTGAIVAAGGSILSVDGGLALSNGAAIDFALLGVGGGLSGWIPVASVSGAIQLPSKLRARNAGECNRCATTVADGILYVRPVSVGALLIVK